MDGDRVECLYKRKFLVKYILCVKRYVVLKESGVFVKCKWIDVVGV